MPRKPKTNPPLPRWHRQHTPEERTAVIADLDAQIALLTRQGWGKSNRVATMRRTRARVAEEATNA